LWGEKLAQVLYGIGFVKTYSDASLFMYNRDDIKVIVPVFVNDITLASKSGETLNPLVVSCKNTSSCRIWDQHHFYLE